MPGGIMTQTGWLLQSLYGLYYGIFDFRFAICDFETPGERLRLEDRRIWPPKSARAAKGKSAPQDYDFAFDDRVI
jgi:hypothetical protein